MTGNQGQGGDTGQWDNKAKNIIRKRRPLTEVSGSTAKSFYQVFEYKPDREKDERYIISGNEPMIALQASLLQAMRKMLGNSSDLGDEAFEDWIKAFQEGFPLYGDAVHKSDLMKASATLQPWGGLKENRPRVVILSKQGSKDSYKMVEFWPDRNNPNETYLFSGTNTEIISKIEAQWNLIRALRGYTIGEYLGMMIQDWLRQSPKRLTLNIVLSLHQGPPFIRNVNVGGKMTQISTRQVSIPYPNKSLINYASLRAICGGNAGIGWGHHIARGYVGQDPAIKNIRGLSQLVAGGSTKEEAKANLNKFMQLSEGHLIDWTPSEPKQKTNAEDAKGQFLKSYRLYPAYIFVENAELVAINSSQQGRVVSGARKVSNKAKLDIWQETEPARFKEQLRELMRSPVGPVPI